MQQGHAYTDYMPVTPYMWHFPGGAERSWRGSDEVPVAHTASPGVPHIVRCGVSICTLARRLPKTMQMNK
eukprot:scaffold171586_cov21-Tisochrysis_lutea.AAC.2